MEKEITSNYFRLQKYLSNDNFRGKLPKHKTNNDNSESENRAQKYTYGKGIHKGYDESSEDKIIVQSRDYTSASSLRVSRVNIDSRYRNIETKNILDDDIAYLGENPLMISPNSNVIRINHPNHGFNIEDKIVLQGIQGDYITLRNGFSLIKSSNFIRINHINHNLNPNNELYVVISNVIGNTVLYTALQNIPINELNKTHKIYFKRNESDIPNSNYYYIQIDTYSDNDYDYKLSDINLYFPHIGGIPINEINANYPLSSNQINGYHIITNVIDRDNYEIVTQTTSNVNAIGTYGGRKCWVARIQDFIEGYPNNNFYKISLKKTFYNVKRIRLISTEFPNTERVVKNYPEQKKNNALYWQISNDGDTVYKIEITPGNYTILTLKEEIESKINAIERTTLTFLNNNIVNNNYYYYTYIISEVDLKSQTDVFSIKLFEKIVIQRPFTLLNSISEDGFQRMRVYHPNHKLLEGQNITISNASSTENVPSEILNASHTIEKILDKDNYQIKLPRYNALESDTTNGGNAVNIVYSIKFRLLFDRPDTIGKLLGFANVGNSVSITQFDTNITNNTPYDSFQSIQTQGNIINLSGDNYILMSCPLFKDSYSSGMVDGVFAKLLLASDPGTVMYNQFVQLGEEFATPIPSLSEFEVSFYDPMGQLFYFNNIEHSYTLEIYEDI